MIAKSNNTAQDVQKLRQFFLDGLEEIKGEKERYLTLVKMVSDLPNQFSQRQPVAALTDRAFLYHHPFGNIIMCFLFMVEQITHDIEFEHMDYAYVLTQSLTNSPFVSWDKEAKLIPKYADYETPIIIVPLGKYQIVVDGNKRLQAYAAAQKDFIGFYYVPPEKTRLYLADTFQQHLYDILTYLAKTVPLLHRQ